MSKNTPRQSTTTHHSLRVVGQRLRGRERLLGGHHFPKGDAERVHVGLLVQPLGLEHLGCRIERGALLDRYRGQNDEQRAKARHESKMNTTIIFSFVVCCFFCYSDFFFLLSSHFLSPDPAPSSTPRRRWQSSRWRPPSRRKTTASAACAAGAPTRERPARSA